MCGSLWQWFRKRIMTLPARCSRTSPRKLVFPSETPVAFSVFWVSTAEPHYLCYLLTFWQVRTVLPALQDPQAWPQFFLPLSLMAQPVNGWGLSGHRNWGSGRRDIDGRCGPGESVSPATYLPSLPALGLGQPASPPGAEGDRTSLRGVNNRVIIQQDETELSGIS